jgi:hypothetical protein
MSYDGTKIISSIAYSTDFGATWVSLGVNAMNAVVMSNDGTKIFGCNNACHISTDFGASWTAKTNSLSVFGYIPLAMSSSGNTISVFASGIMYTITPSATAFPAQIYSLPSMVYDGSISIGFSDLTTPCPTVTTTISMGLDQFCTIPSATVSALPINPDWQQAVPSVNKPASTGKWQFGSWGFCLDSNQYQTCDAQFKGEVCNTGFFKAMLGDSICGKYKNNGPYYCTKQPDYFTAISLAATTALSVIGVIVMVLATVLSKCYGRDYDGTVHTALQKKKQEGQGERGQKQPQNYSGPLDANSNSSIEMGVVSKDALPHIV